MIPECLRCGECCKLPDGSDCKYLERNFEGYTTCTIYNHRLGVMVAPGIICVKVGTNPNQIGHADNCPYYK